MICNDFWCSACSNVSEYRYKYEDKENLTCSKCGCAELEVRLSAPSIKMVMNAKDRTKILKKRAIDDDKKHWKDRKTEAYEKLKI